jgi:pimeloyl-ACP methyl ester carboxylesterase
VNRDDRGKHEGAASHPFEIEVPQEVLDDLRDRLDRTRWTDEVDGAGWDHGTNLGYLRELCRYWRDGFDWREQERKLNELSHFEADVDGLGIHFVHERGKGPDPTPLLLTHGWPDSFYRFDKLIPMLTDPGRFGGDPADSFDVVVPSVPGYGFSDRPRERGVGSAQTADLFVKLMKDVLGYGHFAAHGGDIGSGVTEAIAGISPESLVGIHLTDVPYWHIMFGVSPDELAEVEREYLQRGQDWGMREGAYAYLQSTKPQTPAHALNDSPAGLAAWIVEKFRSWSDCDGDIEKRFTKDELLTNITIYWVTETIGSSFRMYYESQTRPIAASRDVPTGVAIFPKDIVPAPREFGERAFNIERWTEMPRGGHFAAMEEPELLVGDLREFFRPLRASYR